MTRPRLHFGGYSLTTQPSRGLHHREVLANLMGTEGRTGWHIIFLDLHACMANVLQSQRMPTLTGNPELVLSHPSSQHLRIGCRDHLVYHCLLFPCECRDSVASLEARWAQLAKLEMLCVFVTSPCG